MQKVLDILNKNRSLRRAYKIRLKRMIEKGELNKITLRHSEKKQRKDKTRNIDKYVVSKPKLLWQREI